MKKLLLAAIIVLFSTVGAMAGGDWDDRGYQQVHRSWHSDRGYYKGWGRDRGFGRHGYGYGYGYGGGGYGYVTPYYGSRYYAPYYGYGPSYGYGWGPGYGYGWGPRFGFGFGW